MIGTILLPALCERAHVTAIDLRIPSERPQGVRWVCASAGDPVVVRRVLRRADAVIHLATGARAGWRGIRDVDIAATRTLLDAARQAGTRRAILASTNHVSGGAELDARQRSSPIPTELIGIGDPIRPDSTYAAAKAFSEAYGRMVAEASETAVSCLRLGTVRLHDEPSMAVDEPEFGGLPGGKEGRLRRLRATWLSHRDLVGQVLEELDSTERFRLRFAVSESPERFWSLDVLTWDGKL